MCFLNLLLWKYLTIIDKFYKWYHDSLESPSLLEVTKLK